ncbi:phage tail tube protein [Lactobacillus delbrueckii]|uniref:phage tail tube protein n=1 Tax=Lactobacillus delbrueckii TaxID=1584 RepID=UPI001E365CFD|nr:phage tail tube protein [Lactobacillus delbrueckii]MCD5445437.1 phage tail tube protein [Lactobacillus delbrueckii subsp. lactis]
MALQTGDVINSKDAMVTATINGRVIPLIECTDFEAKIEKNKEDVQVLGTHWKHHKVTSIEGTGTLEGYLISSMWLKYALPYINGGAELYFNITVDIEDKSSRTGKQTVQLTDVSLDDIPIADISADDSVLDWKSDLTFEGVQLINEFNDIH